MSSHFFIDRPIFASVLSIIIVVLGLVSLQKLPIAQFPQITPPMVQIDADYPGASAEIVAEAVARPIEVQLPGIDNLLYYDSTSTNDGHMTMRLTFEIGTDVDIAQVQTQNRQRLAEPQLPDEVIRQGVTVKKTSPDLLAVIMLTSTDPRHETVFLSNYALLRVLDNVKRIPGVGDAIIFGAQNYSMRLILNPVRMAQLDITPTEVAAVVREQNRDFPAGRIGREPTPKGTELTIPVITRGRMSEVKEFEDMIVRAYPDGSMVRMRDIARVELGAQSYDLEGRWNGQPNAFLLTFLSPGANALETVKHVRQEVEKLSKSFPAGVSYDIPYDTTTFIDVSIKEVVKTLIEATLLVILVVFLFLQSWRATLIPAVAVPISLIGTLAGMEALGFSINTLTLFGMVLAIGIVVDDAIVVVENVERHMTKGGLSPRDAAKKAMDEVTGPVVAIVLVLAAVFVPVAFLGGITGELYKQFAITIALSVAISGFVALTLSPALCALVLKPGHESTNKFWNIFNRSFDWLQSRYVGTVGMILKRSLIALAIFGTLAIVILGLFKTIPGSFLPEEDQGYFITIVQLPEGASKTRTVEVLKKIENYFMANPAVHSTDVLAGQNFVFGTRGTNQATMFVPLQHWDTRSDPSDQVPGLIAAALGEFAKIPEALILAFNAPSIPGLGSTGGFSLQLQDPSGGDFTEFAAVAQEFVAKAVEYPAIAAANTNFRVSTPRLYAQVDRERAKALGVPISEVFDTMQAYFGNLYVNDFVKFGRVYRVQTEALPEYRSRPDDISKVYVRARNGMEHTMIPLDSVVSTEFSSGPDPVTHFNGFNTALVLGGAAPGYSSGQALEALQQAANEILVPRGYTIDWSGISFQEQKAGGQSIMVFAFALLMVFLVLAALYESWSVPFAVILAIPFGVLGALLAIWARGLTNDIYFQIGLITLIGLTAKNAILIVEFANQRYAEGATLVDAALEAARLRFRPIIMTSMAFILGVFPLVVASGAGAASRNSIGTGVFGGMLAATFLAIFFVPLFFVMIGKIARRGKRLTAERQPIAADDLSTEEKP
jgi:HAE1 family hydrophobic/amphiphilic exporter-1/multidrug efflux pump